MLLRNAVLVVQILFMVISVSLAVIVFLFRQYKIIQHSMWILLEFILFGSILLYATVSFRFVTFSLLFLS